MKSFCLFAALLLLVSSASASPPLVPPVIEHPDLEDQDRNLLLDRLETTIESLISSGEGHRPLSVAIILYQPYRQTDLEVFRKLGGTVRHTFEAVTYGFSGTIPAKRIQELIPLLNVDGRLCVIGDDPPGGAFLDYSAQHVRVRTTVWGNGYTGNSSTTIAILDTGIDDSHPDFDNVSAGWTDTTVDSHASKLDYYGHGSHVAGIALGSGDGYGTGYSPMYVVTNESGYLPTTAGYGHYHFAEVKNSGPNSLSVHLYWNESGTSHVSAKTPSWVWMASQNSSTSPNSLYYSPGAVGVYKPFFGNSSGAGGAAYCGLTAASYNAVGDGYNLFQGMAPGCTLLGVKVLEDDGDGDSTDWVEGLDWCVTNRDLYNIRVINMSLGLFSGVINSTLDNSVNTAVSNGIVVTCSAGNDYSSNTIPSPGNAAKAITVGAINDDGAMTNYSSNGFTGQGKPDVVAPGGSRVAGTLLTSVETNDGDAYNTQSDHTADNYANMWGTSMAAPMVAGLAGLLIDAQEQGGDSWNSTQAEALRVKNIILMTATETNQNGEYDWNGGSEPDTSSGNDPSLDRGGRDLVEGFGRINADTAVEAMAEELTVGSSTTAESFGSGSFERKAMARQVNLTGGSDYDFTLNCISGNLDCDLYLYSGTPDANGNPVILDSATSGSSGTSESITAYTAPADGTYYLAGKYVSGAGTGDYSLSATAAPSGTISADMNCVPLSGTVPFNVQFTVTLTNNYAGQIRRIAGRMNVTLASGTYYASWRAGFTNVAAGGSYFTSWPQTIPALGTVIGDNTFDLLAADVTPAPYNQPPYPPAGDTDTASCTVTGVAP